MYNSHFTVENTLEMTKSKPRLAFTETPVLFFEDLLQHWRLRIGKSEFWLQAIIYTS